MAYSSEDLDAIYGRTNGKCHICAKKLSRSNYASFGARGAWEVEHSVPRANGGSDHMNNLFAACISCNREKQAGSSRSARAQHGRTRAPLSRDNEANERLKNAASYAAVLGAIGLLFAPELMVVGAIAGALLGHGADVD